MANSPIRLEVAGPKPCDDKNAVLIKVLTPARVRFLDSATKRAALEELIDVLGASSSVANKAELAQAVFKREELMSTGIGLGLAVPHVRLASVSDLTVAVGIAQKGITDYASLDDKPVRLIFMIASPAGQHAEYLRLLSAISSRAKTLNGRLLECRDAESFCRILTGNDCAADSGMLEGA